MRVVRSGAGRRLALPGRTSTEIVGGAIGARSVTLRAVEIPVPTGKARPAHRHLGCEEVIHVLSGRGRTEGPDGAHAIGPGDTLLVAEGEWHVTANTGDEPLRLLCFFPTADVASVTEEPAGE
jgi:mannose-6-phosphate isomerase-like protein (cupin superfamily)